MCEVLEVSPSGYYAWQQRPPSKREMVQRELAERIEAVYKGSGETYIEGFYNRQRRHSALDYLSPEEHERLHSENHLLNHLSTKLGEDHRVS